MQAKDFNRKKVRSDVYAFMRELLEMYPTQESLRDWFKKEKWVRIDSSGNIAGPCGTSKNTKNPDRCLPLAKARSLSKSERAATAQKKKREGRKGKTVVPNTKKAKVTREDIINLVVGLLYEIKGEQILTEKDDRCTRIAKRKYDTWPSAYASGAVVRCRRGEIWKNEIVQPADPSKVDPKELKMGIKVEMEHTKDPKVAKKIALQHLAEDPKYYSKLKSLNLEQVQFIKPNFEFEWEEANRYPEFQELGKEGWIDIAKKGHTTYFSKIKNFLGNVDLNFDKLEKAKKERFNDAFERGTIETPLAVKFSNKDYDLVAGNTRLSGLVNKGVDPKIWIVDISSLVEDIHEPMNPGILKKRLGKLSCSKVRAERAKLKDKGTTYAKALQRYLNYHCN